MTLRSKMIRLAHAKPELRPVLLPLLKAAGGPRVYSDEEILTAAAEVAKRDPKKRFSAMAVRRALAEREGVEYIQMEGPILERRLDELVKRKRIVPAITRGFFQFVKETKGSGVEFRNSGEGNLDILLDGSEVGSILIVDGEMIGSSIQREKLYEIRLDIEGRDFSGLKTPPDFKKLTDAKAWVKKTLT